MVNCIGEIVEREGHTWHGAWIWRIFDNLTGILHIGRNGCGSNGSMLDTYTPYSGGVSGAERS